ncbi:site-2 protease family protein [Candidatus Saccharibacteria bacterium]|nr:site-2 protease family protein [Candidatus Saccharibacteria bacterium]
MVLATIVNLGFFAFNILPIPPLDGSRLLYALAPDFLRRLLEALEQAGLVIVFALVLIASGPLGAAIRAIITFALDIFSAIFGVR